MALNWQAPAGGNFEDTFYNYLIAMEGPAPGTGDLLHLISVGGNPTIGVGFDLAAGGEEVRTQVLYKMGFQEGDIINALKNTPPTPGTPAAIEYGYLRQLIDQMKTGGSITIMNQVMADRAGNTDPQFAAYAQNRRSGFAFNNENEVRDTYNQLLPVYVKKLTKVYPALIGDTAFDSSREKMVLTDLAWNGGDGILGEGLGNAIASGNRAEAWFEIRYRSNGGDRNAGIAKRRYQESELFGLYDNSSGASGIDEATSVYKMYTKNRDVIFAYEALFGEKPDGSAGTYNGVTRNMIQQAHNDYPTSIGPSPQSLRQELTSAANTLMSYYIKDEYGVARNFDPLSIQVTSNQQNTLHGRDANGLLVVNDDLLIGRDGTGFMFGTDYLYGGKGNDTLIGGTGDDYLDGGTGDDTMIGGEGEDTYVISGHDRIIDSGKNVIIFRDTNGNEVTAAGTFTSVSGSGGSSFISDEKNSDGTPKYTFSFHSPGQLTFSPDDSVTFVNQTSAAGFSDHDFGITLREEDPDQFNITLTGSASRNEMAIWDQGTDQQYWKLMYTSFPGGGLPSVPLYNEYLPVVAPHMKITGGDAGNFLFGFAGHDEIKGGAGGDIINGYLGYWNGKELTQSGNLEGDLLDGGDGGDWIHGAGADDQLIGGKGNDFLQGLDGDDSIRGDEGNDVLAGGSHADTLSGGDGDDILLGEGYITGSLSLTLDNLASLGFDLTGPGAGYYTGYTTRGFAIHNDAPNGGDDVLLGGAGRDWLEGGAGADILDGGIGNDSLFGGAGDDWLSGGDGNDWMVGDSLDPAVIGDDIMLGGAGDDTYVVNSIDDIIIEEAGEGIDTVQSSVSYTLPENVEYITFTGTGDLNATGNALDNLLSGTSGANILIGNAGNDTLDGFAENDILDGGEGLDWMTGGLGDDTYVVDRTGDVVAENAGEGIDIVQSSITYTLGANVENLILTGPDDINGTGNGLNNMITGNTGANILDGGTGSDTLIGGAGNDTYVVDVSTDVITESTNEGIDSVLSSSTYSLGDNIENLTLTGTSAINGTGNELDNVLIGDSSANILTGGAGNDTLNGGDGADTMLGGLGDDIYVVDNAGDVITENPNEGVDSVLASSTYSLGSNIENFTLTGTSAINATGNELDNVLIGNSAANTLTGNAGNDTLNGGAGVDTMIGGFGDDIYVVDVSSDVVTENAGEGIDTVQSGITYTLGANLENLTLTGLTAINGTGNEYDNVLIGNSAANTLSGGAGADSMLGGMSNDIYIVDNVNDAVVENVNEGTDTVQSSVTYALAANIENLTLTGTSAINGTGNELDNVLTGNSGANILSGGLGNDSYVIDGISDVIIESANEGLDIVQASITYTLGTNIENLALTGITAISGSGNELDNVIIGNSAANTLTGGAGNDTLDGGSGADTMLGGLGNDTFVVDDSTDTVIENANEGTDTVQSSISYTLEANLENLTLSGSAVINGTGNNFDNVLLGNSSANILNGGEGNDILDGSAGADTMIGGLGNDLYVVDVSSDVIIENADEGIDTVQSNSATYTLGANLENLTLTGSYTVSYGTGNTLNNVLIGTSRDDLLDGGGGSDTMRGGYGNDTYVVDDSTDIVIENVGEGTDTIQTGITYTLSDTLENLILTGTAVVNGTGNVLNNALNGNSAANILDAGAGNDFLNGGAGADTMFGGLGNDTYVVDDSADIVIENIDEGTDFVQSSISYALSVNFENLTLTGSSAINGTGNELDNTVVGNSGANILTGDAGNDTLIGNEGADMMFGGLGDDFLNGGAGADTMLGGSGNDTYIVDVSTDIITENVNEGVDSVQSYVSYTLGANIENLTLGGYSNINGMGNEFDNILIGNTFANVLNGGGGTDTMRGGDRDDTYIVDDSTDIVIENANEGTDTVQSSITYSLGANVENLTLTGSSAINGTGNALNNVLIGNSAANTLTGGGRE